MHLKENLRGIVPDEHLNHLSDRFHVIGDIAVLSLPAEAERYKKEIAQAVVSQSRGIRTVLNKTSQLDVAKVFFNSHLGYERMRVASQVQAGENVLVPFAGVGPFAVPLAARGARVIALEKSSEACRWLAENARLNRVEECMAVMTADAFYMAQMLKLNFDRAVIPAPYGLDQILDVASPAVKKGGMVHLYTFKKRHQIEGLLEKLQRKGF